MAADAPRFFVMVPVPRTLCTRRDCGPDAYGLGRSGAYVFGFEAARSEFEDKTDLLIIGEILALALDVVTLDVNRLVAAERGDESESPASIPELDETNTRLRHTCLHFDAGSGTTA
ncbi:hypothetical protein GCM10009612_52910 [Streptomyces beijiangensis]